MLILRTLILLLATSGLVWADANPPIAPAAVDYNVAAPLRTVNVTAGDAVDLQTKMTNMQCGDKIVVPVATYNPAANLTIPKMAASCVGGATGRSGLLNTAGAHTVLGSSGMSAVTNLTGGDNYVIITTANEASLPAAGTKIDTNTDIVNMPTIVMPNIFNAVGFTVADGAHHVIVRGMHVKSPVSVCNSCTSIFFGDPNPQSLSITDWPHHMYVERSYLEGASGGGTLRGVYLMGQHQGVVDSVVINNFTVGTGADHQGVLMETGNHFLVRNNTISADSESVMLGDNNPFGNLVENIVADVTIKNNLLYRPMDWSPYSTAFPLNSADKALTTAAIDSAGTCVTLTGKVPDPTWASSGNKYFIATADKDGNGYFTGGKLITQVNVCGSGVNTLTLNTPHSRVNQTGLTYHISYFSAFHAAVTNKNHIECKSCRRVLIDGNILRNVSLGNQFTGIVLSSRGGNGGIMDVNITNNHIKDVVTAINWSARPTVAQSNTQISITGDGTTNCTGGQCVKITYLTGVQCDCVTGETVQIDAVTNDADIGPNEAKGIWALTKVSASVFTIPVQWSGIAYKNNASAGIFHAGNPLTRIAIKNNLIEETGSWQMISSDPVITKKNSFIGASWPIFTTSDGHDDNALSNTGDWKLRDFEISNNTLVNPAMSNSLAGLLTILEGGLGGYVYSGDQPHVNFTMRSNVFAYSGEGTNAGNFGMTGNLNYLGGSSIQLAGVDQVLGRTNDGSNSVTRNVFYRTGSISAASEYSRQTGSFVNNSVMDSAAKVGFTNYIPSTPGDMASLFRFALTDIFTTGTCTTSTASLTVTCNVVMPTTVAKGTPFKINSDGNFCYVDTVSNGASSSTLTLRANAGACTTGYTSTNTAQPYTLTFKGSGHNNQDPGADIATLTNTITNGVYKVPAGVIMEP